MFVKFAKAEVITVYPKKDTRLAAKLSSFDYEDRGDDFLYVAVRACTADVPNLNYDMLPDDELKTAYKSFIGSPVYVNHKNNDVSRARGFIIDATYHDEDPNDKWVEILMEMDELTFPKLCGFIRSGEIDTVSMGCNVTHTVCSVCGKEATVEDEFCEHVANKGHSFDGKTAFEICHGVEFFEESWVYDPADPTACVQALEKEARKMEAGLHVKVKDLPEGQLKEARRNLVNFGFTPEEIGIIFEARVCDVEAALEEISHIPVRKAQQMNVRGTNVRANIDNFDQGAGSTFDDPGTHASVDMSASFDIEIDGQKVATFELMKHEVLSDEPDDVLSSFESMVTDYMEEIVGGIDNTTFDGTPVTRRDIESMAREVFTDIDDYDIQFISSVISKHADNMVNKDKVPEEVEEPEEERACPICANPGYDGEFCEVCEYVEYSDGFGDIDTEKFREQQEEHEMEEREDMFEPHDTDVDTIEDEERDAIDISKDKDLILQSMKEAGYIRDIDYKLVGQGDKVVPHSASLVNFFEFNGIGE